MSAWIAGAIGAGCFFLFCRLLGIDPGAQLGAVVMVFLVIGVLVVAPIIAATRRDNGDLR